MNTHWIRFVAIFLIVHVAGCQTTQLTPDAEPERFLSVTNAALATARFAPAVNLTAMVRGKSDAAGKGFAAGAGSCLHIMSGQSGGIAGGIAALATLICMPVAVVAGAVKGSKEAAPIEDLERAEARLHPALDALSYQKPLGDHMIRYAAEAGLAPFVLLSGQGPSRPDEAPDYRPPNGRAPDVIIEVSVTDIIAMTAGTQELVYHFLLKARGRVVRVGDHAVQDQFNKVVETSDRRLEELVADGGKLLTAEFDRAYREIAEAFVDEWLLIDHRLRGVPGGKVLLGAPAGVDENPEDQDRRIPAYVLHPIYPKLQIAGFWRGIPPSHLGPLDPVQIDTLRPTLRWETFPRPHDFADFLPEPSKPHDVTYDLRIFRSQKFYFPHNPPPCSPPPRRFTLSAAWSRRTFNRPNPSSRARSTSGRLGDGMSRRDGHGPPSGPVPTTADFTGRCRGAAGARRCRHSHCLMSSITFLSRPRRRKGRSAMRAKLGQVISGG